MSAERIRDFHPDDVGDILQLFQSVRASGHEPVYGLNEVLASCQKDDAVVAVAGDEIVGAAVGRAAHEQGWVVFLGTLPEWQESGLGTRLLAALERRLAARGIGTLSALIAASETRFDDFIGQGFEVKNELRYAERRIPAIGRDRDLLRELGGRVLSRGLWESVAGMQLEKDIIERRLVTPLAEPELADRYGVVPPRAVVLFGPPGTGKTTFAKAVASRLEWPFVEVFPSRLAGDPSGLAGALRDTFSLIAELDRAVVFIDEVEEIASHRKGDPPSPLQGVTNELLKIIPEFRDGQGHLLICATNFIRALDSAFLRHGRFDYVIPIGLPDDAARSAIWRRLVPPSAKDAVDTPRLVAASAGFTPADVEFAARKAAQSALERAIDGSDLDGPTTADYLEALRSTRATVSAEVVREFEEDITRLARL